MPCLVAGVGVALVAASMCGYSNLQKQRQQAEDALRREELQTQLEAQRSSGDRLEARQRAQAQASPAIAVGRPVIVAQDVVASSGTELADLPVHAGQPIDVSARMPDGTQFAGLSGLKRILLSQKDEFASAFTERLLTYALARGVDARDMPAIRTITRSAAADGYRIQTVIKGIVHSAPFTLRRTTGQ